MDLKVLNKYEKDKKNKKNRNDYFKKLANLTQAGAMSRGSIEDITN